MNSIIIRKKIVVACDSFKGSLSSADVAKAAEAGILSVLPDAEVMCVPVADGGEGTVHMLVDALHGRYVDAEVSDPLGRPVKATYGIVRVDGVQTAIIEMAQASGLTLLTADERNPRITSSSGTGERINHAFDAGCRHFIVGIGGSATNDGGAGMLRALGVRFLDRAGNDLPEGGSSLRFLDNIDTSEARTDILECPFTVMCDVDNPLVGANGASAVFGPQKGASAEDVSLLDAALARYGKCLQDIAMTDVASKPGAGAAGGMGASFYAFFNSRMQPGISTALDLIGFSGMIADAALVITGEGKLDRQTLRGKAPLGVLRYARKAGVPVVAVGGAVEDVVSLTEAGFAAVMSIQQKALPLSEAMKPEIAANNVSVTLSQITRLYFKDCI